MKFQEKYQDNRRSLAISKMAPQYSSETNKNPQTPNYPVVVTYDFTQNARALVQF